MINQASSEKYNARYRKLNTNLIVLYVAATLLASAIVLILNIRLSNLMDEKEDISYLINVSGRQRMLSQNITKTSLLVYENPSDHQRVVQLDSLRSLFSQSHQYLVSANLQLNDVVLDSMFAEMAPSFDGILSKSYDFVNNNFDQHSKADLLLQEQVFLPRMDQVVKAYEMLGRRGFLLTNQAVTLSNYLIILTLVVSGGVVFYASQRMVKKYADDIQELTTELDETKVELERSKIKERFAYVASHDLQEPVRTTISLLEVLEQGNGDELNSETKEIIGYVKESSLRMSRQIRGLLDYSRLGKNQVLEKVNLNELIDDVLHDLKDQISVKEASIDCVKLPKIIGYPVELRSIFQNLLSNALKFVKAGVRPEVTLSFLEEKRKWVFIVQDNGIGIDPSKKEQIFQIFQRLHGRGEFEGYGIGLAHCQRIAELHRGEIWVESSPDEGSTFKFTVRKNLR